MRVTFCFCFFACLADLADLADFADFADFFGVPALSDFADFFGVPALLREEEHGAALFLGDDALFWEGLGMLEPITGKRLRGGVVKNNNDRGGGVVENNNEEVQGK